MNHKNVVYVVVCTIFILIFWPNISNAALDCSKCHTGTGKSIVAKDTIEISNRTCLKCHNAEYPPVPIGYNTHLAHVGKYSAKVDYLARHPEVAESLNCGNCHVNIGSNCRNCHVIDIPHIKSQAGYNCKGCHGEIDKLFRHPTINLKIHNIFNFSDNTACTMCHNPDDMRSLKLANGETVSIGENYRLCYQCHSMYYRLWDSGSHYLNKTMPKDESFKVKEIRENWENGWRVENTCTNCHNPHNPNELYQLPVKLVGDTDVSNAYAVSKLYVYIVGAILAIIILVIILNKYNVIKLSKLRLPEFKLPKLNLSKISIPISISIEKEADKKGIEIKEEKGIEKGIEIKEEKGIEKGEFEVGKKDVKDDVEKDIERFIENISKLDMEKMSQKKLFKNKFLRKYKGDILFLLAICIILGSFYIIFGAFMPIVALISESMSPHMEKGDIVFFTDISKIKDIKTFEKNDGYTSFDNYGDVILYKPLGKDGVTPIIHRAMYYVNEGEEMWPGGEIAPHAGYITKGDNPLTNSKVDQQGGMSHNHPVKDEWVIGVANFRIPYIGYIRLILPI